MAISREIAGNQSSLADATIGVIPEPASAALLVFGLSAVVWRRRRR